MFLQSCASWPSKRRSQHVPLGEKLVLENPLATGLETINQFDLESYILLPEHCVNPYDVSPQVPISSPASVSPTLSSVTDQESNSSLRQSLDDSSGAFYKPIVSSVKLEMDLEAFKDLTCYVQSDKMTCAKYSQDALGELNTPIFAIKEPFDFGQHHSDTQFMDIYNPISFKIKAELESNNINNKVNFNGELMFPGKNIPKCTSASYRGNVQANMASTNYSAVNNVHLTETEISSPLKSKDEDMYFNSSANVTPIYMTDQNAEIDRMFAMNSYSDLISTGNNVDHLCEPVREFTDLTSRHQVLQHQNSAFEKFSDLLSGSRGVQHQDSTFETPENSRSVSEFSGHGSPKLSLDLVSNFKMPAEIIATPDVVDAIDGIESERNFNILQLIGEEDILPESAVLPAIEIPSSSYAVEQPTSRREEPVAVKTWNKRKSYKDEDEDYIPPPSKIKSVVGRKSVKIEFYDSDSSSEDERPAKVARRGRPPKRSSLSTDSRDPDGAKYRELRDKNNEASRRSRLNRKVRETMLEKEADELQERNVKLKAQVSELDKTVSTFRNNLMQLLLKK